MDCRAAVSSVWQSPLSHVPGCGGTGFGGTGGGTGFGGTGGGTGFGGTGGGTGFGGTGGGTGFGGTGGGTGFGGTGGGTGFGGTGGGTGFGGTGGGTGFGGTGGGTGFGGMGGGTGFGGMGGGTGFGGMGAGFGGTGAGTGFEGMGGGTGFGGMDAGFGGTGADLTGGRAETELVAPRPQQDIGLTKNAVNSKLMRTDGSTLCSLLRVDDSNSNALTRLMLSAPITRIRELVSMIYHRHDTRSTLELARCRTPTQNDEKLGKLKDLGWPRSLNDRERSTDARSLPKVEAAIRIGLNEVPGVWQLRKIRERKFRADLPLDRHITESPLKKLPQRSGSCARGTTSHSG